MTSGIPYGRSEIYVDIPEKNVLAVVEPNEAPERDAAVLIEPSLASCVGSSSLARILSGARIVLVIVNDGTRPTPTEIVPDSLLPALAGYDVRFLSRRRRRGRFSPSISPRKADIVVSVAGYPMDIDLYKSQKTIEKGVLTAKEGGILILVSSCREEIGDSVFIELLSSCHCLQAALEKIGTGNRLAYHKAATMAMALNRSRIWAVTDLAFDLLGSVFLEPKRASPRRLRKRLECLPEENACESRASA